MFLIFQDSEVVQFPAQNTDEYFQSKALKKVLETIFFKSSKNIGIVFMEELCAPDNATECAHWHQKLRDHTATRGFPVGAIAFAATVVSTLTHKSS